MVALLAGCGGSQLPIGGAPVGLPQSRAIATHIDRGGSWVLPAAKSEDLLYVSDVGSKIVDIYSYPGGVKVGQLTGFAGPGGLCVDRAGDVFVTNGALSGDANVIEFAHGGKTPIRTLNDPGMQPSGCAASPITGDLAVTNSCRVSESGCDGHGNILLYPNASGSPKRYVDRSVTAFYFCGYDNRGTLYADGSGRRNGLFDLVRLPKGGRAFVDIQIDWDSSGSGIANPGAVQWDGKLLAIGDEWVEFLKPLVYRIDPANGHVAAVLRLHQSNQVRQFTIHGDVLIAPNEKVKGGHMHGQIIFYDYPNIGKPRKIITGLDIPAGAVVSPAKT
jgi:DNA-binding beta-propeller fold protein YncE